MKVGHNSGDGRSIGEEGRCGVAVFLKRGQPGHACPGKCGNAGRPRYSGGAYHGIDDCGVTESKLGGQPLSAAPMTTRPVAVNYESAWCCRWDTGGITSRHGVCSNHHQ